MAWMARTETEESALSPDQFTETYFQAVKTIFLGAHLNNWGLVTRPDFQDVAAIRQFMVRRYRMRDTDAPYDDVFG